MRFDSVIRACALAASALVVGALGGCDGATNEPPIIGPVDDQVFRVDQSGTVRIEVSDAEGDPLSFVFVLDPEPPSRAGGLPGSPRLEPIGGGALLSWTPSADDAGAGEARYRAVVEAADDRGASSAIDFEITVVGAGEMAEPLRFAEPAGQGLVVTGDCLALPIVVTGSGRDDVLVEVDTVAGRCDGVDGCVAPTLEPPGPGPEKMLSWCPTAAQHVDTVQHELRLEARSIVGDAVATKRVFARFHRQPEPGCGGQPPIIEHVPPGPQPIAGALDYVITADIRDDLGIKVAPVLAYAVDVRDPPLTPTAIDGWQAVEFVRQGERAPDRWQAAVPNLDLEPGANATIHYAIFAVDDDDDASAECDQSTAAGLFTLDVAGGGAGAAYPPCTPCRTDAQCGGDADRCAVLFDGAFCALDCAGPEDCGPDELCVETPTAEGDSAFLCVPADQNCGQLCEPDAFERAGNDAQENAAVIEPGPQEGLTLCDEDEDWFTVAIEAGDAVVVEAAFDGSRGDLDLGLQLPGEAALEHQSRGGGGDVEVVREPCAPVAGLATVAVWAYAGRVGPYALDVRVGPGDCDVPCVADRYEAQGGNDDAESAPEVALPFASGRLTVCRGDIDFFRVRPPPGKLLRVDLQLQEERLAGDLGLRLIRRGELVDESAGFRPAESVTAVTGLDEEYVVEVYGQTPRSTNTYTLRIEALDGMPCADGRRCPQGQICSDGVCIEAPCRSDDDCGPAEICLTAMLGQPADMQGGRCAERCRGGDCGRGEVCKPVGGKSVCVIEGALTVGARCGHHADCAGLAVCLDLPGGYCGQVGCEACPGGTACAEVGPVDACLRECDSPADCRVAEDYACQLPDDAQVPVCLPEEPEEPEEPRDDRR